MKSWVRNTLRAGVLAAGFLLFAASPAHAADQTSGDSTGFGNGNNISVPVAVAGTGCGNGVGVFGAGGGISDWCATGARNTDSGSQTSGDSNGFFNNNNVSVPISGALTVCGNGGGGAGGGLGISGGCATGAKTGESGYGSENSQTSGDSTGFGNGNNVSVPVAGAASVCGNGLGIFGGGLGISGSCMTGAKVATGGTEQNSGDSTGFGNNNNWSSPVAAAGTFCGNGGGGAGVGVGISGDCTTKAKVGSNETAMTTGASDVEAATKSVKNVTKKAQTGEALPSVNAPLPAPGVNLPEPVNGVAKTVTGGVL